MTRLLIANRGEIAVRIAYTCHDLGIETIAIFAEDDANSAHVRAADKAIQLSGSGAQAYLNIQDIVEIARRENASLIHPGYGFLSENPEFASACNECDIVFIGPTTDILRSFGNKATARRYALEADLPVVPGTGLLPDAAAADDFRNSLPSGSGIMLKAAAGGGGRGMRKVYAGDDMAQAFERCQSEAKSAFGSSEVYAEQLVEGARHIEVQILGDTQGNVSHLWERDCTLQRRNQKVVEIAPSPTLPHDVRHQIIDHALRLARCVQYTNIGTFEFLVAADSNVYFMEVNPRLQVEHTITEEISGCDLVATQIKLALGQSLQSLKLDSPPPPRGYAIQCRLNAEVLGTSGEFLPSSGQISSLTVPTGPGIRFDTFVQTGHVVNTKYDSLLAKLIVHADTDVYNQAVRRLQRALSDTQISGIETNLTFLQALFDHPNVATNNVTTNFIAENAQELAAKAEAKSSPDRGLDHSKDDLGANDDIVAAPTDARIIELIAEVGTEVVKGAPLAILEVMKMEHEVIAPHSGIVREVYVSFDSQVARHDPMFKVEKKDQMATPLDEDVPDDNGGLSPDLARLHNLQALLEDESRDAAVAKRHARGQLTAREVIAKLCDEGSFLEYGALAVAARRSDQSFEDLIRSTPGDGILTGLATINAPQFGTEAAASAVLAVDYTVLAGTQGHWHHKKIDRMIEVASHQETPVVFFAEGGGGRPGDTDSRYLATSGLNITSFRSYAALSGQVPLVGVVSGYSFAGSVAFAGCADVIIATKASHMGMGGPAMIEGGGLGSFGRDEIGPAPMHARNGVIDILVEDDTDAVNVTKQYLSFFQGRTADWTAADQTALRKAIPTNRRRIYDIRSLINTLCDVDTFLELRQSFGQALVTGFARIEGRPIGLIANDPKFQGGAIGPDEADKGARFIQLCSTFGIPIVSLCDVPGFMVGPEVEQRAQIRHVSRMFVVAASIRVPMFTIVTRRAIGLGAQAMMGGSASASVFTAAWPSAELAGMGIEGAVRLGLKDQIEKIADPDDRDRFVKDMMNRYQEASTATAVASQLEVDAVIDPKDTRDWIIKGLERAKPIGQAATRSFVDTW